MVVSALIFREASKQRGLFSCPGRIGRLMLTDAARRDAARSASRGSSKRRLAFGFADAWNPTRALDVEQVDPGAGHEFASMRRSSRRL